MISASIQQWIQEREAEIALQKVKYEAQKAMQEAAQEAFNEVLSQMARQINAPLLALIGEIKAL